MVQVEGTKGKIIFMYFQGDMCNANSFRAVNVHYDQCGVNNNNNNNNKVPKSSNM